MGHDITATSKSSGERLSCITIGAFNQSKSWILYESLDCTEFNNGVSGNGGSKTVTESAIKISLSKFKYLSGESEDDFNNSVSESKPCKSAALVLKKVMRSIGNKLSGDEIKTIPDSDSLKDVERFLTEIQGSGEIVIDFL